jgi:hypothetical protein
MPATTFVLTETPVQILDGTRSAYVQETIGKGTRYTVSTTPPNIEETPYCTILRNDLNVTAGFPIWAWTPTTDNITITVLISEQPL